MSGGGDIVIVESISRFARNTRDLLNLMEQLSAKGVEFVSKKEAIDTTTPTGKFMLTVFGAMVFEVVSAGSPLHQGVSGEPHGQVGAQARVAEIQLGGLGQALQLVVGKGGQ